MDEDRFSHFHMMDVVTLFGVAIKPSLASMWWGGEGGLEGSGNISFETFWSDDGNCIGG